MPGDLLGQRCYLFAGCFEHVLPGDELSRMRRRINNPYYSGTQMTPL